MTMVCPPMDAEARMAYTNLRRVKMEPYEDDQRPPIRSTTAAAIPIATVVTANENWRGKNDPAERRRIQNRLNQRAFRQRQRAGESPKQYKPRSMSSTSPPQESDDDEPDSPHSSESSHLPIRSRQEGRSPPRTAPARPDGVADVQTGYVWDELAQLINRNLMAAAAANAQHLDLNLDALHTGTAVLTQRLVDRQVPAALTPVELQYQVPHDPIIDTLPHARFRFNLLRAIAARQIQPDAFSKCIRASGALLQAGGNWQRGGVVVWSFPEQVGSWELSEPFVRRWAFLLQGCEDLIAATNAWRSRRSERLFPLSLERDAEGVLY